VYIHLYIHSKFWTIQSQSSFVTLQFKTGLREQKIGGQIGSKHAIQATPRDKFFGLSFLLSTLPIVSIFLLPIRDLFFRVLFARELPAGSSFRSLHFLVNIAIKVEMALFIFIKKREKRKGTECKELFNGVGANNSIVHVEMAKIKKETHVRT